MRIVVHDYRGCVSADLVASPIALVAGLNASGKSSIAQAVMAALTGIAGRELGAVVRTGATEAQCEIWGNGDGCAVMRWPKGRASRSGKAPEASVYAAGLDSIIRFAPRDRARELAEALRADPTVEDLAEALAPHGFTAAHALGIMQRIEQAGWDGAHQHYRDAGVELKGAWRRITTQNYGSRVAAAWRPDLEGLNENDLAAAVGKAKDEVERGISAAAVSQAEHRRLTAEGDKLAEAMRLAAEAQKEAAEHAERFRVAQQHRASLPPAEAPQTLPCPHCGQPVIIESVSLVERRLVKYRAGTDDGAVKERRMAIADADGKLANAQDALNTARQKLAEAHAMQQRAEAARDKLQDWPQAVESGIDVEAARTALGQAETRLAECRAKKEADLIHRKVEANDLVLGVLAGDGLRAAKLAQRIGTFNTMLATLCKAAGWQPVTVDAEMAIWLGQRPYALLSTSEQYRVRAVLQVGMAGIEGADLVVLDGAEVLDGTQRGGLFEMLKLAGLPALVCMTLTKREQMPDLEKLGRGRSYWLTGGSVAAMAEAA